MRRIYAGLFTCLLVISFGASDARAVTNQQITVTPFLQNVEISGNDPKTLDVVYTNDSDKDRRLSLSVLDFGSLDETGGVAFVGNNTVKLLDKYQLSPWMELSDKSVGLGPHQSKTVHATVRNDSKMSPGGHYAAIVATVVSEGGSRQNQVNFKQKISSLIFAVKTGGEKYDLSLSSIDSDKGLTSLPTEADLTIRATGNVHVVPRGIVYLKTKSGQVLAKGVINAESGYVLPDTSRIFTVNLNYLAKPKFWETSFKLQVDYRYDGVASYASKSASFRVYNIKLLGVVFALILALFGLYKNSKKIFHKKVKKTD